MIFRSFVPFLVLLDLQNLFCGWLGLSVRENERTRHAFSGIVIRESGVRWSSTLFIAYHYTAPCTDGREVPLFYC